MNSPERHASYQEIVDFAADRKAVEATTRHIAGCARCAGEAAALRSLLSLMAEDRLTDAPEEVQRRATRIFRQMQGPEQPGLVRRLVAPLSFDSAQRPATAGVRSGLTPTRQRIFDAGEHQVEVRTRKADGSWLAEGQVLGPEGPGRVELIDESGAVWKAELNREMEFTLPALSSGTYTLVTTIGDLQIEVTGFDLEP